MSIMKNTILLSTGKEVNLRDYKTKFIGEIESTAMTLGIFGCDPSDERMYKKAYRKAKRKGADIIVETGYGRCLGTGPSTVSADFSLYKIME